MSATTFLDSTGRSYALPAHTLPSARGQGEPLSGRLNPPDGAKFADLLDAMKGHVLASGEVVGTYVGPEPAKAASN